MEMYRIVGIGRESRLCELKREKKISEIRRNSSPFERIDGLRYRIFQILRIRLEKISSRRIVYLLDHDLDVGSVHASYSSNSRRGSIPRRESSFILLIDLVINERREAKEW